MKQKIVIKVQMTSERSKSKALKIAAEAHGVESVALEGSEKTRVVVIGEKVDAVRLTSSLRNKVGDAEIISIAEVKPAPTSREKEKEREREREKEKEKERREREREREKLKKEEAAKKLKRELEAAKNVKPAQTREKEREKERERKKKEEARKQAEAKETKILINLLRAKLAM